MIDVAGLSKHYRSGRLTVTALDGVSFDVRRAENFIIAGKSGSGKTTLLNCIGGLEKPDRGTIRCQGVEVSRLSRKALSRFIREKVGFVFQRGNLLSYLTVGENLAFPLALNGIDGRQRQKRIEALLDRIELPDFGSALPDELSGGEIQRVAFARAIAHAPAILLADEPTASLDSATGRRLIDLMVSLSRNQQCTLVAASHDPEVIRTADRGIQLKDGKKETRL